MTEDQRLALEEEATSLPIHVRLCAYRHQQILSKLAAIESTSATRLGRIERAAWALVGLMGTGLGASQLMPIMRALAGQ